ncbi:pentatricopeptide repeat-containing protein At3g29230-like [Aristolochia californica]|uniref:pentatricopeptide repeat-containing protein At3g29230-like n=1 Tax=Aristolochia californica TaxID=171875 RepID=UPI0035D7FB6A
MVVTDLISDSFAVNRLLLASMISVVYAELVFSQIDEPTTFSWNTLIRAHAKSSNPRKAVVVYNQMRRHDVLTDNYTYPFVIKACGSSLGLEEGTTVHGEVFKRGLELDLIIRNCLVDMYCKCRQLDLARKLFDEMLLRDVVSWNSMIGGYVGVGEMGEAQKLFDKMPERDVFSWAMMIDGYGKKISNVNQARRLFDAAPVRDLICWNSMVAGYRSVGDMTCASKLFEEMPVRNVISWSIMIDGYAHHGKPMQALSLFRQMLQQGTKPDKVAAVGALMACAQLGALDQGKWVHLYVERNRLSDIVVQTALVDMYTKCGSLDQAWKVFDNMLERNVVSWTVMMVGLGLNGLGDDALGLFVQMEKEGYLMDDLIFLGVLSSCSHAGLVNEGLQVFDKMKNVYGVKPKAEHYGCLVDLLGRAGRLDEALSVIKGTPMKPTSASWGSFLAACRIHKRMDLAGEFVGHLLELEGEDSGVYVLLSNIYAEEGMWEDVLKVRDAMTERGIKKEAGRSAIELNGIVYEFVNEDKSLLHVQEIYSVIWSFSTMPAITYECM